jgi:hypothetical protein
MRPTGEGNLNKVDAHLHWRSRPPKSGGDREGSKEVGRVALCAHGRAYVL